MRTRSLGRWGVGASLALLAVAATSLAQDVSEAGRTFDLRALLARAERLMPEPGTTIEVRRSESQDATERSGPAGGARAGQSLSTREEARTVERFDAPASGSQEWGHTVHVVEWKSTTGESADTSLAGATFVWGQGGWAFRDQPRDLSEDARAWVSQRLASVLIDVTQDGDTVALGFGGLTTLCVPDWLPEDAVAVGAEWELPESVAGDLLRRFLGGLAEVGSADGSMRLLGVEMDAAGEPDVVRIRLRAEGSLSRVVASRSLVPARDDSRIVVEVQGAASVSRPMCDVETSVTIAASAALPDDAVMSRSITSVFTKRMSAGGEIPPPPAAADSGGSTDVQVERKGVFAEIDVERVNDTVRVLLAAGADERTARIARIEAHPGEYAPPALYALADVLFRADRKPEAASWFYLARLRASYDALRCADATARQAVTTLNQRFGGPIVEWSRRDPAATIVALERALALDAEVPYDYDHRWINLHGMDALLAGMGGKLPDPASLSVPQAEWAAIRDDLRTRFRARIEQLGEQAKKSGE